jgi:hypothetical protein
MYGFWVPILYLPAFKRVNQKPYIEKQTTQWPKVGRYQTGSQKPYIEEQTTPWLKVGRYKMGTQKRYIEEQTKQWPKVGRYQSGSQKPYIEEQTTQWSKEKDKQRSTKHTYKTKDRLTRTPLKNAGELRCSGRVGSSCCTSCTRRVNLVTNPVICREFVNRKCSRYQWVIRSYKSKDR